MYRYLSFHRERERLVAVLPGDRVVFNKLYRYAVRPYGNVVPVYTIETHNNNTQINAQTPLYLCLSSV